MPKATNLPRLRKEHKGQRVQLPGEDRFCVPANDLLDELLLLFDLPTRVAQTPLLSVSTFRSLILAWMRVCNREVLIRPSSLVASASPCSRATAIRTFRTSSTLSKRASPPSPPSNQPRSEALPPPAPFKTKTVLSLQPNVYYPANQLHSVPKASSPNSITRDRAGAIGGGEVYAVQGERSHHRVSFTGAKFMTSAGSISSLPKKSSLQGPYALRFVCKSAEIAGLTALAVLYPKEVIIAGRSNSGKSSLINALLSSTKLVKTSGKTVRCIAVATPRDL
jgi:hypothetical protein